MRIGWRLVGRMRLEWWRWWVVGWIGRLFRLLLLVELVSLDVFNENVMELDLIQNAQLRSNIYNKWGHITSS